MMLIKISQSLTSSNCFFSPTNSSKSLHLFIIKEKEKQQILLFNKLEPANV